MLEVRALAAQDNRESFESSSSELNDYFRSLAGQTQRRGTAQTYVVTEQGTLVAFMTVRTLQIIVPKSIEKGFGTLPVPALLLARMATAKGHEGKGAGTRLVAQAITVAQAIKEVAGCVGIVVDPKPGIADWYVRKHGFVELEKLQNGEPRLFLSLNRLRVGPQKLQI